MIAMSLIISAAQIIAQNYEIKPGREWIKNKTKDLEELATEAIKKAHGGFTDKELATIAKKLEKMEQAGLDKVESCRAYLSMLVMITGDLLVEIPKTSVKHLYVDRLNALIVEMWEYFSSRNQRQDFDTDGMCLGMVYNDEFKEAV
jgi:hypothetical protein